jgi:hypothetical protein
VPEFPTLLKDSRLWAWLRRKSTSDEPQSHAPKPLLTKTGDVESLGYPQSNPHSSRMMFPPPQPNCKSISRQKISRKRRFVLRALRAV